MCDAIEAHAASIDGWWSGITTPNAPQVVDLDAVWSAAVAENPEYELVLESELDGTGAATEADFEPAIGLQL